MRITKLTIAMLLCGALMACGSKSGNAAEQGSNNNTEQTSDNKGAKSQEEAPKSKSVTPKRYGFRIVAEYPHATTSYTQGLEYVDGVMWEGTGSYGESELHTVELSTGKTKLINKLDDNHFGEGIVHHNDKIYQLTWLEKLAYVYDSKGNFIKHIPYTGEGWGITTDGEHLYMSDGTPNIYVVDPETFARKAAITVRYNNRTLSQINELEWIDGKIWANVYLDNTIVVIDPTTGIVEAYLDLRELKGTQAGNADADVLNGIAYNDATGHVYVTGKNWNKLFELEIIK